jgi:hypothetical protein
MSTRLTVNLSTGVIEAEGELEFVQGIYDDLRDVILKKSAALPSAPSAASPVASNEAEEGEESSGMKVRKPPRRRGKISGPSCASRIVALKDEEYFSELRSAGDVGAKLREKGTAYEAKHVAASLIDLVKRGALRRVQDGGSWSYQNP